VAPRERKPALAALAVLLILLGALGATVMVLRAGDKISVVEITQNVAAGQPVPASAIAEVEISEVEGVDFIRWNQRGDLTTSYVAKTNLEPGSVLSVNMITRKGGGEQQAGKSLVGISLKEGTYPIGLHAGDTVAAYLVGNDAKDSSSGSTSGTGTAGSGSTLITDHLVVETNPSTSDSSFGGDGSITINVLADNSDAGPLTIAASANEVALVRVPSKN